MMQRLHQCLGGYPQTEEQKQLAEWQWDGPSPHLSWSELACRDGTPYPHDWRESRARILAVAFEDLRDVWTLPIPVLSAYRTREHNQLVDGARHSQHLQGLALDLGCPRCVTLKEFHDAALGLAKRRGSLVRGVGKYVWGAHIDCRPTPHLVVWTGKRLQAEVT